MDAGTSPFFEIRPVTMPSIDQSPWQSSDLSMVVIWALWRWGDDNRVQTELSKGSIFLETGEVKDGKSELINSSKGLEVLQNLNGIPSRRGKS